MRTHGRSLVRHIPETGRNKSGVLLGPFWRPTFNYNPPGLLPGEERGFRGEAFPRKSDT